MSDAVQTLTVVIPLRVKPRGGRKAMVTPGLLALERRQDITLIKAVARAFRWRRMLESGQFATIKDLAAAEKINSSYVSRVLRLTLPNLPAPAGGDAVAVRPPRAAGRAVRGDRGGRPARPHS